MAHLCDQCLGAFQKGVEAGGLGTLKIILNHLEKVGADKTPDGHISSEAFDILKTDLKDLIQEFGADNDK